MPIYSGDGQIIGAVSVGILVGRVQDGLGAHLPALTIVLLVALLLGIGVAFLHVRHVKFEQREAMLRGIREGVVADDGVGRITIVNPEARRLPDLPHGLRGTPIDEAFPESGLPRVLGTGESEADHPTHVNGRWIVVSRTPVRVRDDLVGAISTFRDQTQLEELTQAHEFANELHTIAGLLELGWHGKAVAFVTDNPRTAGMN